LKSDAMQIEKVGLMTPGDMGQGVAMQIKARGYTVCTAPPISNNSPGRSSSCTW
jgi:hypothetical protein